MIAKENLMTHVLRHSVVLALSFLCLASFVLAQSNTASLVGAVTDPTGAVISSATVSVTNVQTQVKRATTTGADGNYEILLLPIGEYSIAVEATGFKRAERSGIVLEAGNRIKIDMPMQIGDLAERVRVEAEAPMVATQNSDRGIVIGSEEVANLPLNGRNFAQLISLQQGVIVGSMIGNSITFNGLPYNGTTINIDGTDAANPDRPTAGNYSGQTRLALVSQEFIQEFKTSQGVFSAEIGRATGGSVNVITKSGTNEFHGSIYEFIRNDKLDARNFFARAKDPLRLNQFGATASGPIIRNKLFIFGGWEASRERRGVQVTGTVPTDSFKQQLIAANPRYAEIVNLMPPATEPLAGEVNRGFHRRSDSRKQREDVGQARLDFAPRPGDNIFARYTIFDAVVVQPNISPVNGFTYPSQDRSFTFSWAHTLNARMINEARFGANKQDLPRNYAAFVPGGAGTLQGYLGTPDLEFLRANGGSWTIADNFSLNTGRHSLKMGFEVRRYHNGRTNYQNPIYVFDSAADLLASTPTSATLATAYENVARIQTTETGVFVQDDFRVRRDLTLNMGLRYEYYTPPTERDGRLYNVVDSPYGPFRDKGEPVWSPDRNNFGPRLGLAWDMFGSSKNVIRAGAGVYYSDNQLRGLTLITRPPDLPASLTLSRGDSPNLRYPVDPFRIDPALLVAPVSRIIIDPNHRTTYTALWSFDYQRQITSSTAATIGYVGNHGVKQLQLIFLNQFGADGRRPVPSIGQIRYEANDGMSLYHALQTSIRRRFSRGLTFNAHYTYGNVMINGGGSEEGLNDLQDPNNIRGSRSRAAQSLRHVLTMDYGWELPIGQFAGSNAFAKALLRGWRINGITNLRTGFPLNITSGRDNFGSGQSLGQRPNYIGGDIREGTSNYRTTNEHNYINRAPFVQPGRSQYGNLGAFALTGPGSVTFDTSLFKNTVIRERATLQFRAEFFNFTNRPNFGGPNANLNSGTFGRITSASGARELQFGLKLLF
jgi:hypothetical protein